MYLILSILNGILIGCESVDKDGLDTASIEIEIETPQCPNDVYPAILQVWRVEDEERNVADTSPFCEAPFEIELREDGVFYSAGDCNFEAGEQTRTLSYIFQGQLDDTGSYIGEVVLFKQNGDEEQASFTASCTETEAEIQLRLDWSMTITTPNGEREHVGVLATAE